VTWQPGRDKIAALLEAAELEQVTADHIIARHLLDDASRHLATAAAAALSGDLSGATAARRAQPAVRAPSHPGSAIPASRSPHNHALLLVEPNALLCRQSHMPGGYPCGCWRTGPGSTQNSLPSGSAMTV
jgi:hypothetical protein